MKIHQEADADMTHSEMGQNLGFMRRDERGDRFDCKNDGIFDHHIGTETERKCGSFANDRHGNLIFEIRRRPGATPDPEIRRKQIREVRVRCDDALRSRGQ